MVQSTEISQNSLGNETGFRHLLASARYSFGGFKRLIQEAAFRQEIAYFGIILILFAFADASAISYLVATILFLVLIAVEALNTGLEHIVDELSPEISDFGKHTKDLGSFAVFCLLIGNGIFALYVILQNILPDWVQT